MSVANVNFRMEKNLKKAMEQTCNDMGLSLTTAFTIFAKKVVREQKIPFEVANDSFYCESNINYLRNVASDIETGKSKFVAKTMEELEVLANE